jgi:hypothetical protein
MCNTAPRSFIKSRMTKINIDEQKNVFCIVFPWNRVLMAVYSEGWV